MIYYGRYRPSRKTLEDEAGKKRKRKKKLVEGKYKLWQCIVNILFENGVTIH